MDSDPMAPGRTAVVEKKYILGAINTLKENRRLELYKAIDEHLERTKQKKEVVE